MQIVICFDDAYWYFCSRFFTLNSHRFSPHFLFYNNYKYNIFLVFCYIVFFVPLRNTSYNVCTVVGDTIRKSLYRILCILLLSTEITSFHICKRMVHFLLLSTNFEWWGSIFPLIRWIYFLFSYRFSILTWYS